MAEKLRFYSSTADNLDAKAVETDSSVARQLNVKADYLFRDANTREIMSGTMPINSSVSIKLDPVYDGSNLTEYIIPKGYHDGTSRIYTGKLSEYTPGNATPEDVINNKIFWVNGERKVGTLDVEMANQEGNATPEDVLEGVVAWANKVKIVGTIPRLPRKDKILNPGESYTIPYGLSAGTSVISVLPLDSQTEATATDSDIINGKTAWVNGKKITGSLNISDQVATLMKDTDATKNKVLSGSRFYSAVYGQVVSGTMTDHSGEAMTTIPVGYQYAIPEGYYDGFTKIATQSLYDATQASAVAKNIIAGKTAWVNGEKITGIMPYIDPKITEVNAGVVYTIPEGYHTGNGKISVKPLDKETIGTAEASSILEGKVAWVNGKKVIGIIPVNEDLNQEITPGESFFVPNGYHSGTGTVWVRPLGYFTPGDAVSGNIAEGKIAWVNGKKVVGSMAVVEPEEIVLDAGVKYTIPEGYHDGTGSVEAETLSNQTEGTAEAEDILLDKTAWVNGQRITGTLKLEGSANPADVLAGSTFYNTDARTKQTGTLSLTGSATEEDVVEGVSFYSTNAKRKLIGSLKLTGTALADNVLTGTSFYNTDAKTLIQGSMPNIGSVIVQLDSDTTYAIPKGYHDGTGVVKAPTLSSITDGTAEAGDIFLDKTAWVNGEKITGTLQLDGTATSDKVLAGYTFYSTNPKQKIVGTLDTLAAQIIKINAGEEYTIPYGIHSGNGKVVSATLAEQTPGDAVASNILYGKIAWVNGDKITGLMPKVNSVSKTLEAGEEYTIPLGYHDGTSVINAKSLASQTVADATASDLLKAKTAWVNGTKISGTIPTSDLTTVRINSGNDVTLPAGYYPDGITIYSLYTDRLDLTGTSAWYEAETQSLHPEADGYVDGDSLVITATVYNG